MNAAIVHRPEDTSAPGELDEITLEGDIQKAFLIAVNYAANTRDCLMPGLGAESISANILDGADVLYASGRDQLRAWTGSHWATQQDDPIGWDRSEKIAGVTVTRAVNQKNGGEEQQVWWFPFESLRNAKMTIRGVRVR